MKPLFLCAGILLLITSSARAQKSKAKDTTPPKANSSIGSATTLSSTGSYPAKANTLSIVNSNFTIADPILTTLDARANGANISIGKSGIVGMPKRAYGFANGRLLLHSTSATTFGTQTGSGAVGTGTSLGTFGSNGPAMSVNGKSPFAGINMWGNARNMNIQSDSVRAVPLKKQ